ncbi:MAG: response regulator [Planctomycetota bacterium]
MADANPPSQPPADLSRKRIFTTGEAAAVCKVSQQTIIRCFDSGRLTGFRVPGSKFRRIPREELIRFMRANDIPLDALEGSTRRILCVDDDPKIVELFNDILGDDPRFEVKTCGNGYDAGLMTHSFRPHLIVLDYMLPDINGNVVCERLREREELAETKVIFISGVVEPGEVEKLMEAGADDFLQKPFDLDELTARIEKLLGLEAAPGSQGGSGGSGIQNGSNGAH